MYVIIHDIYNVYIYIYIYMHILYMAFLGKFGYIWLTNMAIGKDSGWFEHSLS